MMKLKPVICGMVAAAFVLPPQNFAASHREAPITALDQKADITDFFAFVSYEAPNTVTFIMNVDPFLEPGNGPNYFPFDPNILYTINIYNNNTALPAVQFNVQFQTTINAPAVFTGFVGAGAGINAPANSPAPVSPGTPIVPPAITALSGAGTAGLAQLHLRQGEFADAIKLLDQRRQSVGNARNLCDLADALDRAGHRAFHDFEARATAEQSKPYNANVPLILYYAGRGAKPAAALELATRESQLRHDFATLDALAWALYAYSRYTEAKTRITEALSTGVRNPGYFCHASKISAKLNDAEGARKFAQASAALDPSACDVEKK